jgi:lipoprotein-anchoring transpeptidase ErfK/SrfK
MIGLLRLLAAMIVLAGAAGPAGAQPRLYYYGPGMVYYAAPDDGDYWQTMPRYNPRRALRRPAQPIYEDDEDLVEPLRRPARRALPPLRPAAGAPGRVEARIDVASQRMIVSVDGRVRHVWKVSTGRAGFPTPRGVYRPQRLHVSYFSKKYYNSPMPYSIFFRGGYAIHGTNAISRLGGPASHGCVRLSVGNARTLFELVRATGPGRARIVIS